jgi:hypothetical protein
MSNRRVESFLLRVVIGEVESVVPEELRGRIQHIGSGDERHFHCIADALAFIREQCSGDFERLTVVIEDTSATRLT